MVVNALFRSNESGHSPGPWVLQESGFEGQGNSCRTCTKLAGLSESMAISWGIFPPQPFPGYSMYFTCSPLTSVPWGEPGGLVEEAMGSDCGLDMAEDGGADGLSTSDQKACREQYNATFKRATWLGVPPAFLQQMAVCGRCTVCAAFSKVRSLWRKIKAAVRKVVEKLQAIKLYLFGYSFAPFSVRQEMQRRFDAYLPEESQQNSSLLEVKQSETAEEVDHIRMVEDALWKQLAQKPQAEAEHHLSLLQTKIAEAEKSEEALLAHARRSVELETVRQQQEFQRKLPGMKHNLDCREVLEASAKKAVVSLSLIVSFPNVAAAIVHAVSLNVVGALHSLIPSVSITASGNRGIIDSSMDRCLEALREAREPYLDKCTHEAPLMACTARTYQRLMQGALSQQWWPLMHNSAGTYGSIDLGYSYDSLMSSLKCAGKGSCLEKGLADMEKEEKEEWKTIGENSSAAEADRFAQLQCSFAGNRVDTEDTANNKLPVFTDKIWAAALKAHGNAVEELPSISRPCPSFLPFVVAFCASDLRCTEEAESAGVGFFGPGQMSVAQREVAKYMQPFENSTKESVKAPIFTEREKLPRDRRELDDIWRMLVSSNIDMAEEEDAFEWNFLWRTANVTAELGLMQTWPRIFSALNGSSSESVDWIQTRLYWERVLFLALRRLRAREARSGPAHVKEDRSLADVALNLQSIFETKLCSPGALGGLKEKHLRRLGVRDEVALVVHSLDTDNVVKALWKNWMVLHIKLRPGQSKRRLVLLQHLLKKHSCRCMCYDACGKLEASASASCQALWPHDDEKFKYWRPVLRVKEVVLDRVYRPRAAVLKDADIQVITRPALGGCGTRLEIRPHRSFGRALVGFPARCNTPDLFRESKSMDLKITLWSNNERDDEPLEWNDFVEANRPDAMWGNTQADDFDRSLFKPPEPTEGHRPAAEEDLSWIDKIADEYLDDAHGSPEPDDLDPEDSGDFDADDYADLDTEFLDSLLPESPVKSQ